MHMNYIEDKAQIQAVAEALASIESELKALDYWRSNPPAIEAFNSTTPFFMDTMELHEWLQFVLIFGFNDLISKGESLPKGLAVFPYAYEFYHDDMERHKALLKAICRLDACFKDK